MGTMSLHSKPIVSAVTDPVESCVVDAVRRLWTVRSNNKHGVRVLITKRFV